LKFRLVTGWSSAKPLSLPRRFDSLVCVIDCCRFRPRRKVHSKQSSLRTRIEAVVPGRSCSEAAQASAMDKLS
jgi:hypothetical protein